MNKKKLAFAAASVVMAGAMVLPLAACGGGETGDGSIIGSMTGAVTVQPNVTTDENGVVSLSYRENTVLRMNIGNQNKDNPMGVAYTDKNILQAIELPDGKTYEAGDIKPAWQEAADVLNLQFADRFANLGNAEQITTPRDGNNLGDYDFITAGASTITQNTQYLLNLTEYLDYMPNYKAFLDANPAVYYSLTSDTTNGAMYYAPYFDGLNDIEKYVLAERTWINDMLSASDADLAAETTTFAAQGTAKSLTTTSAYAKSYMGTEGSYEVDTTLANGTVGKAKIDYNAAHAAATSASSDLGKAIAAAGLASYTGASGNIVDIMNAVINATNGTVTGGQLVKILQEYIDVAYTIGGEHYTNRADVFNSVSAAWDVDLMVALCRCVVTSPSLIGATSAQLVNIWGIAGRQATTQRRTDILSFAGELYGIRGMESRIENIYLDAEGNIKDARQNAESYDLLANFGDLAKEGILYTGGQSVRSQRDFAGGENNPPSTLFMHDYSQTQTTTGFSNEDYNVAPILTPVSKWDTDDNGSHETIMRFTESWRSVKNTGFCVPLASVNSDANKLSAVLAFIDYLFSNDGQIVMTYGPQSTNGNENPNGWWYATEATNVKLEDVAEQVSAVASDEKTVIKSSQWQIKPEYEGQYFVFENKVYNGMVDYSRAIPKITDDNFELFSGGTVNGVKLNDGTTNGIPAAAYSYTNYARHVLGTTLPIGNKDQGFEYQCTAPKALEGAAIVSRAIANGTIKHVKLSVAENESMWYMIAPTSFALDTTAQSTLNSAAQTDISGKYFYNSSSTNYLTNVYIDIAFYGFDTTKNICGSPDLGPMQASGEAYVSFLNARGLSERVTVYSNAWLQTAYFYNLISK